MVLAGYLLPGVFAEEEPIAMTLVLHLGTMLPVLYFYRAEIIKIIASLFKGAPLSHQGGVVGWLQSDDSRWLAIAVIVGTIPTALMGLLLEDYFEGLFKNIPAVCAALFVTGCLIFSTQFFGHDSAASKGSGTRLTLWIALIIGIAQGFAITPGISRSGSTIAVALLLGVNRDLAARFSFLLSIPAITGALIIKLKDGLAIGPDAWVGMGIGFLSSMIVGYLALVMLVALVKRGGLHNFAYYVWPVSIIGLVCAYLGYI